MRMWISEIFKVNYAVEDEIPGGKISISMLFSAKDFMKRNCRTVAYGIL